MPCTVPAFTDMSREEFVAQHVISCQCNRLPKYDRKKPGAYHSLAYSRRKCAKGIWRNMQHRKQESEQ
jgi:hypothetical protein